jgi:hypothetical protein
VIFGLALIARGDGTYLLGKGLTVLTGVEARLRRTGEILSTYGIRRDRLVEGG